MEDSKRKILIVDDDKFLIDMYSMKFSEAGFDVTIATNAQDAINQIKNGLAPDICLVDVIMPGKDGFGFVEEFKSLPQSANVTVIFLTNLGQQEDIDKGVALGADGYIVKASATPTEVLGKVADIVNNKK